MCLFHYQLYFCIVYLPVLSTYSKQEKDESQDVIDNKENVPHATEQSDIPQSGKSASTDFDVKIIFIHSIGFTEFLCA